MTRLSAAAHVIGRLSVVFSAVVGVGCRSATMQEAPDAKYPLPPGVESNPAAFRKSIATFKPMGGHTRGRDADCFLGLCKDVQVRIEALGNTLLIDPDNPPSSGVPVARLVNNDTKKKELYYGLRPESEAEYYLWVDSDLVTKKARWTLLEVPWQAGNVLAAKPRSLKLCHKRGPNEAKASEADFAENKHSGKCDKTVASATSAIHTASLLSVRPFTAMIDYVIVTTYMGYGMQGGWIDCSNGCCT